MLYVPPDRIANRLAEQEEFRAMLDFESDARLLLISDQADTGKSTILERLHWNCEQELGVLVSRVRLEDAALDDAFRLVSRVRQDLLDAPFPEFDRLTWALDSEAWADFSPPGPVTGAVDARQAAISGGQVAGTMVNAQNYYAASSGGSTASMRQRAERRCVEAFVEDLRRLCATRPAAILLDSFERAAPAVDEWIRRRFLRSCCFDDTRGDRLVVVLAGRELPSFGPASERFIRSRRALGWDAEHVREFLRTHPLFEEMDPLEIEIVGRKVAGGVSIGEGLRLAQVLLSYKGRSVSTERPR